MALVGVISINEVYALGPEDCTSDQVWQNNECVDDTSTPKNDLNLQTDKVRYGQGDVIVITGLIPNIENFDVGDVAIIVRTPDDNIINIFETQANSDGSFQKSFRINPSQFRASGDYTIFANFHGLKSQIAVEIIGIPDSIVVTTDKPSYEDGDTILVTGEVSELLSGSVDLSVLDPKGRLVKDVQIDVGSDKKFSTELTADSTLMRSEGTYKITAFYGTEHRGKTTFTFEGSDNDNNIPPTTEDLPPLFITVLDTARENRPLSIFVTSTLENKIYFLDYNIRATQNNIVILDENVHYEEYCTPSCDGQRYKTIPLPTTSPINIQVTFQGYISSGANLFGPIGEVITLQVVPKPPISLDDLPNEVTISAASGSSTDVNCETTAEGCFTPKVASVALGGKVIFSNTDTAGHTFTSGNPTDGASGEFDSGLAMVGGLFEWTPTAEGEFSYFCWVHPWMTGIILVGEGTYIPPQPDTTFDLQVIMESQVYDLSDTATMNLSINGASTPQNVALEISDPRGTSIISRSFMVDSQGVSFEFRIDENFKTGTYKVVATTNNNGNTITDTAYFKVKSQYNSFKITSVQVTDQQGNPSNLEKGEMGFIKVNLEASKAITTLVTVNLFDSDLTSIGIGSIKTTLSSGNSEIILSFMIPSDVAVGSSDIYVNAFSDWPSNGGIPLTGEVAVVENIE